MKKHKKGEIVSITDKNNSQWKTANRNVLVCGAQNSRKSQGYVRTNILQSVKKGCSIFVTDPSGDIYRDLSIYLELNGYIVKVLNTKSLKASDAWDCFETAKANDSIDVFADIIIKNTVGDGAKSEAYFENAATLLLQAICYYVLTPDYEAQNGKKSGTFEDVFNVIVSNSAKEMEEIFEALDDNEKAKKFYRLFEKAENVKGSTILGLGSRLQLWINEDVQAMTSIREIDLSLPGRTKCAYFCITSDQEQTRAMVAALFFSFIGIALANYADTRPDGVLPVPVHFFLDEFCNLGCLPQFETRLATWRKRGIAVSIIVQSLSQLRARYPDTWEEIINGCKYNLFMGCNDLFTSEYYEKLSGTSTVLDQAKMKRLNFFRVTDYASQANYFNKEVNRPTITADEFRTLDSDKCILFIQGCHPIRLQKYYFYNDPRGIKINKNAKMKQNAEDHIPDWRKRQGAVASGSSYEKDRTDRMLNGTKDATHRSIPLPKAEPKRPKEEKERKAEEPLLKEKTQVPKQRKSGGLDDIFRNLS